MKQNELYLHNLMLLRAGVVLRCVPELTALAQCYVSLHSSAIQVLIVYTRAPGLRFIGDYDLKPPRQISSSDSNVNLPCDNDFLCKFV